MPKARIEGDLGDEIGRRIGGVIGRRVVTIVGARLAEQIIAIVFVRGERALRVFYGESDRHRLAEVFRQAKPVLTRESEPDIILRVDGCGTGIVDFASVVARSNSRFVLGYQAPHLAAEDLPTIIKLQLSPSLAKTKGVAVGLGCS